MSDQEIEKQDRRVFFLTPRTMGRTNKVPMTIYFDKELVELLRSQPGTLTGAIEGSMKYTLKHLREVDGVLDYDGVNEPVIRASIP